MDRKRLSLSCESRSGSVIQMSGDTSATETDAASARLGASLPGETYRDEIERAIDEEKRTDWDKRFR